MPITSQPDEIRGDSTGGLESNALAIVPTREMDMQKPENMSLDIEVFISEIGISCTDNDLQELCYVSARGIRFHLDDSEKRRLIILEVEDLQIDDQLKTPQYPVVLWFPVLTDSSKDKNVKKPVFQVTLDRLKNAPGENISMIRAFYIAIQQFRICVEERFALSIYAFVSQSLATLQISDDEPLLNDMEEKGLLKSYSKSPSVMEAPPRVYIERLLASYAAIPQPHPNRGGYLGKCRECRTEIQRARSGTCV